MKRKILTLLLSLFSFSIIAQYTLSGKITEEGTDNPLAGANIVIKGSTTGTLSDANGNYTLSLKAGSHTIVYSFIGFKSLEKTYELNANETSDIALEIESKVLEQEILVYATKNYPVTKTEIEREELEKLNLAQDLPQLLNFTPSIVSTSDAGAGVGYTGMRIRGSDPTRVNITINGVPLNDAESQGTFLVDLPDFASSIDNITIQRGVGTSVNGAGAFGASVNISTSEPNDKAFAEVNNTFGSFNTLKHNIRINSGLINDRFALSARLSKISSDGFIDRSAAELKSYFVSGSYFGENSSLTLNVFSGKEVTQQAWYGVSEAKLNNDIEGMESYANNNGLNQEQRDNLFNSDSRTYNFYTYDNEIDDYQQDHFQLIYNTEIDQGWSFNTVFHYTRGRGFFEQFKDDEDFEDYGLENLEIGDEVVTSTDLIRRRWLDNDFYGNILSLSYQSPEKKNGNSVLDINIGAGWNKYIGDHFGELVWMEFANTSDIRERYYFNEGTKSEANTYFKVNAQVIDNLFVYADLQLRKVSYNIVGIDNDRRDVTRADKFTFFNPKFGAKYLIGDNQEVYASFAIANKEPNRGDYTDASAANLIPKHETLRNLEIGYSASFDKVSFAVNYYLMDYKNQLIPTGTINDVGDGIRINIPDSYRTGLELQGKVLINEKISWQGNATFSQNKNKNFFESIIDYDEGGYVVNDLGDTDIALSPNVIVGSNLTYRPFKNFEASILTKHVGKQFLDNTSSDDRIIDAYTTNDLRLSYQFQTGAFKNIAFTLLVNNILDEEYSSNGYTYAYKFGDIIREDHFFPQAGRNFLFALKLRI